MTAFLKDKIIVLLNDKIIFVLKRACIWRLFLPFFLKKGNF